MRMLAMLVKSSNRRIIVMHRLTIIDTVVADETLNRQIVNEAKGNENIEINLRVPSLA